MQDEAKRDLSKSKKKCSKFRRRASLHDSVFNFFFTLTRKLESFAVILSAVALPIVLNLEFNFEVIL